MKEPDELHPFAAYRVFIFFPNSTQNRTSVSASIGHLNNKKNWLKIWCKSRRMRWRFTSAHSAWISHDARIAQLRVYFMVYHRDFYATTEQSETKKCKASRYVTVLNIIALVIYSITSFSNLQQYALWQHSVHPFHLLCRIYQMNRSFPPPWNCQKLGIFTY